MTSTHIARATQTGDLLRVPRVILRATHTLAPFVAQQLTSERADVVVLDSNALWGHIAVRTRGLPAVSLMTTILLGSSEFRRLRLREWLHLLRPMLPSLAPIVGDRSRLLRSFGACVPRPAFPAVGGRPRRDCARAAACSRPPTRCWRTLPRRVASTEA